MANLAISGLASGFDWQSVVSQLADAERAPEQRLATEQAKINQRNAAYGTLASQLSSLKTSVDVLKDPTLFGTRATQLGDSTIATAKADPNTALGTYTFDITHLATASKQVGENDIGHPLSTDNNVSGLVLSAASLPTAITAGTFTVNGQQVTVATTDTLQQVFDRIGTATGGNVTASYDSGTDRITLASSTGTILLGSAADTSNFLQVTKLNNNGSGSISSLSALGVINSAATLANANFATTVSDGGAGAGEFKINGVSISYNAGTDSVSSVLSKINNSSAGVTASYDSVADRFMLSNKTTGDLGIFMQDITGNFLAASKLSSGSLSRGDNLAYTINGGSQLTSYSNDITADSCGITGLSVTALKVGSTTVEIDADTDKIKSAVSDFITAYNKTQTTINSQTASSTDAQGKVTAGVLAGELEPNEIASRLRSLSVTDVTSLSGTVARLAQLGYASNGTDDTLSLGDSTSLDTALASNLNGISDLFTNATNGIATRLSTYLDQTVGDNGLLINKQSNLTKQSQDIDTQIANQEKQVQADSQRWTNSFVAMETARSQINQQLQFLAQRFGTSTSG